MKVQHLVNGVSHVGFHRDCRCFRVAQFKDVHGPSYAEKDLGIMTLMWPVSRRLITIRAGSVNYLVSLLKTLPSFMTNCTFCRTVMSWSGSPFTATMSA